MATILLVCSNKENFAEFVSELKDQWYGTIEWAKSGGEALEAIRKTAPDLVIAGEILDDTTGLGFLRKLVAVNPLINCTLVSGLSSEDFHEATEGLGVLMQLPPTPGKEDAKRLLEHVGKIISLST